MSQSNELILAKILTSKGFSSKIKAMLDAYEELEPEDSDGEWQNYATMGQRLTIVENAFPMLGDIGLVRTSEISIIPGFVVCQMTLSFVINIEGKPSTINWMSRLGSYPVSSQPSRSDGSVGHAQTSAKRALLTALGLMNHQEMFADTPDIRPASKQRQVDIDTVRAIMEQFRAKTLGQLINKLKLKNATFKVDINLKGEMSLDTMAGSDLSAIAEECRKYQADDNNGF